MIISTTIRRVHWQKQLQHKITTVTIITLQRRISQNSCATIIWIWYSLLHLTKIQELKVSLIFALTPKNKLMLWTAKSYHIVTVLKTM